MRMLDFAIIGAQKCATTTLFELLRQHPDINLPLEKELPFFTEEDCSSTAWDYFARHYYGREDNRLWGKVTPQYMGSEDVPARLASLMPDIKLIAVLRDPLDRTRSHFRMAQRRNTESRDFATAISAGLRPHMLARGRAGKPPLHEHGYECEANYYITWSEYGRILAAYRRHFEADQILVLYTDDLEQNPKGVLDRILRFLAVDRAFDPRGLGEVKHAGGGGSNRVPHGVRVWLRKQSLVAHLWQLVPAQQQGRIRFLYERFNNRKGKVALPLPPKTEQQLISHFAKDLQMLEKLGVHLPCWASHYGLQCSHSQLQNAKFVHA